jgi:TolB-like protein
MVVLPFANIGGDPEQEHFVDGVAESLTTDLSRLRGSFVIGRNTAFTYKGKAVDLKQIGRELNVRYVLEGSVQRAGNRMRVNVQLIDAETGNHLWAERFDKPLADLFDMQDEIVARLANTLSAQLVVAEARRAEKAPNPDSMDLYFQGIAWFNKGLSPDNVTKHEAFSIARSPPIPTMSTRSLDRRVRTWLRARFCSRPILSRLSRRPKRSWPKPCRQSPIMRGRICSWDSSR